MLWVHRSAAQRGVFADGSEVRKETMGVMRLECCAGASECLNCVCVAL